MEKPGCNMHLPFQPESYIKYEIRRQDKIGDISESENRFVSLSQRKDATVFVSDMIKYLTRGKYQTNWRGVERMQSCTDAIIYEELIWEVKPATILEFGSFKGGSALWMADVCRSYELDTHVYSIDIDHSYLDPRAKANNLTFLQCDVFEIEKVLPSQMLKDLPHPWVIVEDAHVNLVNLLEYLHDFMKHGDYLLIEDTNPNTARDAGMGFIDDIRWEDFGTSKIKELRTFVARHPELYSVDTKYTDMFGYNGCWNLNGYLKRM